MPEQCTTFSELQEAEEDFCYANIRLQSVLVKAEVPAIEVARLGQPKALRA